MIVKLLIKTPGHKRLGLSRKTLRLGAMIKDLTSRKFKIRKLEKNTKDK